MKSVDHPIAAKLQSALTVRPDIELAVLFGSAARQQMRTDSDVDVGFVPTTTAMTLREELDLQAELGKACGRVVDLVRLDTATTLLRWRAAREGVLIRAHPPTAWSRFRARAAIEHADFGPALERGAERIRRRLATGSPEGTRP